jgi:hypothetical protein
MPVSTSTAEKHPPQQTNIAFNGPETEEDDKKRDREHKKRSKNWTRVETLKLIKLRTELEPRFSRSGRKMELWDEIAVSLRKEQFFRDAQQCRDKWEKLMAGFKDVREGLKDRNDNPYYDDLHPLLSGKCLRRENLKKEGDSAHNENLNSRHLDIPAGKCMRIGIRMRMMMICCWRSRISRRENGAVSMFRLLISKR